MSEETGYTFIEKTKYENIAGESDEEKGLRQPPLELPCDEEATVLDLPSPNAVISSKDLKTCMENRRSLRNYARSSLKQEELSYLLWYTQGVKKVSPGRATFRFVPSAGARHAFETYVLVNRVRGMQPGLYRYIATEHKLSAFNLEPGTANEVVNACFGQSFVGTAAATFIWTAVPYRMNYRYQERGYRYLFLDCGHVCQNLYLAAESIDCGACAVAAFNDDDVNRILKLDGRNQFAIYIGAVGKKNHG